MKNVFCVLFGHRDPDWGLEQGRVVRICRRCERVVEHLKVPAPIGEKIKIAPPQRSAPIQTGTEVHAEMRARQLRNEALARIMLCEEEVPRLLGREVRFPNGTHLMVNSGYIHPYTYGGEVRVESTTRGSDWLEGPSDREIKQ